MPKLCHQRELKIEIISIRRFQIQRLKRLLALNSQSLEINLAQEIRRNKSNLKQIFQLYYHTMGKGKIK